MPSAAAARDPEALDARARFEPHDEVGREAPPGARGGSRSWERSRVVCPEQEVDHRVADPDDRHLLPRPVERGLAEERLDVRARPHGHPVADVEVVALCRDAVDDDLVGALHVRQAPGDEQGPADRRVEVGIPRRERTDLGSGDGERRERERARVDDLGQGPHGCVVEVVPADLRPEHDGVGRGRRGSIPRVRARRAPGTGHRRECDTARQPGEDPEHDERPPSRPELAPRPHADGGSGRSGSSVHAGHAWTSSPGRPVRGSREASTSPGWVAPPPARQSGANGVSRVEPQAVGTTPSCWRNPSVSQTCHVSAILPSCTR